MTYEQAVEYLSNLNLYGWRMGNARMRALLKRLGDPQEQMRVLHITGTNGKGSTATFLSFILRAAGYRTGTYLSPYVFDLRERVQVNGEHIPKTDFTRWIKACRPHVEHLRDTEYGQVTEFELKTALAYAYFAEQGCDFAVMEVGLGGRLDATNVMIPEVSVITSIGLDHTDRLGPTHADIAYEKGMIIKPGRPVVSAAVHGDARDMIRRLAGCRGAELIEVRALDGLIQRMTDGIPIVVEVGKSHYAILSLPTSRPRKHLTLAPRLLGSHQASNVACAVGTIAALQQRGFNVPDEAIKQGVRDAWLPGRMQIVQQEPLVVLDGAHNAEAAQALAEAVPKAFQYKRLILVFGMLKPHEPAGVLQHLLPLAHQVIFTSPPSERAYKPEELTGRQIPNVPFTFQPDPHQAFREALTGAVPDDLVLITGSFYLIGEWEKTVKNE
jgi:dihydrofolate synthase/folylpolyglutamate synthase